MERTQIKTAREAAGISQSQLADYLGKSLGKTISRQYIHQLESGSTNTSASEERLSEISAVIEKAGILHKMMAGAWSK